jgi:hypothetical protein
MRLTSPCAQDEKSLLIGARRNTLRQHLETVRIEPAGMQCGAMRSAF